MMKLKKAARGFLRALAFITLVVGIMCAETIPIFIGCTAVFIILVIVCAIL